MQFSINPPAIIRIRSDTDGYGSARGPYVSLPANTSSHQLPHELIHVKQWWAATIISAVLLASIHLVFPSVPYSVAAASIVVHGGLYTLSKRYRFWAEAEAYRASVKATPARREAFVKMLHGYNTGKTLAQCRAALKD